MCVHIIERGKLDRDLRINMMIKEIVKELKVFERNKIRNQDIGYSDLYSNVIGKEDCKDSIRISSGFQIGCSG